MRVDESTVIFGPMLQVGWASASSTVTCGELVAGAAPERTAARGEHDPGEVRPAIRLTGTQALVHGAVLGVDRHELGAGRRSGGRDDRTGGDERLLVREREPLARLRASRA